MERKMRIIWKACKVLPFATVGGIAGYQIRKWLDSRKGKDAELEKKKQTGDFKRNIHALQYDTEKALYQRCVEKIEESSRTGDMHCYLLSSGTCDLPEWIKKKLLAYGLDLCCHTMHDGSYWCEAYWDRKVSGKMREYQSSI